MSSNFHKWVGIALTGAGHLAATTIVAVLGTLLVLPAWHAKTVVQLMGEVPRLYDMSVTGLALHFGLAACVWALIVIIYKLAQLRMAESKGNAARTIKLSKGSVITETLVIMPIFLVLSFGMIQLAINNIAGILANVAAYEAARAAWIWAPEQDVRAGDPEVMCKIAVAFVMTPVAPGEYWMLENLPEGAPQNARMVALGANVPFMGVLASNAPAQAVSLFESVIALSSFDFTRASHGNLYLARSLDNSQFWQRTVKKFSHAYHAAACNIQEDHSVQMEYKLHMAMPVVRRIFGELDTDGPGGRGGYYATFKRNFGFRQQVNVPNASGPQNIGDDPPEVDYEYDPEDYAEPGDLD